MEADAKEPTGVTRGQNAVYVAPQDWSALDRVLLPLIERIDTDRRDTQLLIVTADAEGAVAAAGALVARAGDRPVTVVAATASPRAARLLKAAPMHIVIGAPNDLVTLLHGSALKADGVRTVVFAWLDSILESIDAAPLENLLSELPKDGARIVLAGQLTPQHEALIERYARRARREIEAADETAAPLAIEYVTTTDAARGTSLRRLLDALDLPRAEIFARNASSRAEASAVIRTLGYTSEAIRLSGESSGATNDPLVLFDFPASREELRTVVGTGARQLYAVLRPSQVASLRALGGGEITPVALLEAAERARGKDAAMRSSIRDVLASADVRREVLALEPLLSEFDGIEIAAAALRMLEQQRPTRPASTLAQAGLMQRLFVNLGEKDGIRAPEIVAAITSEAGVPSSQVGRVEVRDTHSIVEVAAPVAELVAGKLNGATVRGRKVQARVDLPREVGAPRRDSGGVKAERSERSERPDRGRGGERSPRPFNRDKGERPSRPFNRDRGESSSRGESTSRGERPTRSFDRGDRPARPFEKSDRGPRGAKPSSGPRRFDRDSGPRPPRSRGSE